MEEQDRYFDIRGLSQYASLSVRTIRDYLIDDTNPIPSYSIKRKILVKKSEFDDWLKKHRTNTENCSVIADRVLRDFDIK